MTVTLLKQTLELSFLDMYTEQWFWHGPSQGLMFSAESQRLCHDSRYYANDINNNFINKSYCSVYTAMMDLYILLFRVINHRTIEEFMLNDNF